MDAVKNLAQSGLDVFAHNIETVAGLQVCLTLHQISHHVCRNAVVCKSTGTYATSKQDLRLLPAMKCCAVLCCTPILPREYLPACALSAVTYGSAACLDPRVIKCRNGSEIQELATSSHWMC